MTSRTINNYRLYCNTENAFNTIWDTKTPTTCPNNKTHLIDNNSISIIDNISSIATSIIQSGNNVNDNFKLESKLIFIPPNQTVTFTYNWPYNIAMMVVTWTSTEENRGDIINGYIAPNTTIGIITQNINIGDTIIHVSPTVLQYLKQGYLVQINNGISILDLGVCTTIDLTTSTIKCLNTANITMNAGSMLQMTIHNIKNIYLYNPEQFKIGEKHVSSQSLPANTNIQLSYQNNGNVGKHFMFYYEYLY